MRFSWLAALCLASASPALARSYQVDDLLRLESYGQVLVDPGGRWAVIERRSSSEGAASYRYGPFTARLRSKLLVSDLHDGGTPVPLFAQDEAAGYWSGGFSPSGKRMIVFRLTADRLSAGILDMATRKVRWLALAPDLPDAHPAPLWRDDDHVMLVALKDGGLPALLSTTTNAQRMSTRGWSQAEAGREVTARVLGSGKYLDAGASYRDRAIIEVAAETGLQKLRFEGDVLDLALSRNGRRLAILTRGPLVQPDPKVTVDPAFEPRRQRLAIVDLASGTVARPCAGCDIMPSLLQWSPLGEELLYFTRSDGAQWSQGVLWRYDAAIGRARDALPSGIEVASDILGGSARAVHATWAGGRILVLGRRDGAARVDWYAVDAKSRAVALTARLAGPSSSLAALSPAGFAIVADGGLWRVDWAGGARRMDTGVVNGTGVTVLDIHSLGTREFVNGFPSTLVATLGTGDERRILVEDGRGELYAYPADPSLRILAAGPAGSALVYSEDEHGVGTLSRIDRNGSLTVDRINRHLADVEPARRILLHSKAVDGTLLNHWLTLPAHAGSELPPLVIVAYPGFAFDGSPPASSLPSFPNSMAHPLLLAGQGYAVLQPAIPLRDGPSDPLEEMKQPIMDAIAAARATGLVATGKPLLLGHSYGGYAVTGLAATSPGQFAGVVSADGIYDLSAGYGVPDPRVNMQETGVSLTTQAGWYENGQGRMGSPPWRDPERYVRNSPWYRLEQLDAPVLISAGDLDYVPVSQADHLFAALYRLGKDARFLRFTGESHDLTSPANVRRYWDEVFAFLGAQTGTRAEAATPDPKGR